MTKPARSIADRITDFQAASEKRLPPDVSAAFSASVAQLKAAGAPRDVAAAGTPLKDTKLLDGQGDTTSLYAATGGRTAVLVFYRGAWCGYCTIALKTYNEQLLPRLDERDFGLLAISPQKPEGSFQTQTANGLHYPVLSDPANGLARQLKILAAPAGEDVRAAQRELGLDLTTVNADGTDDLPMPTVVIVDPSKVISWIDVRPDYTAPIEPSDILIALDSMR